MKRKQLSPYLQAQRLLAFSLAVFSACEARAVDFATDVEPIIQAHCVDCHGPDEQESQFRLDRLAAMLSGGNSGEPAVVPGKPDESFLLKLIRHKEPGKEMPPDESLSKGEIELIEQWIVDGAKTPESYGPAKANVDLSHWAFQPVRRSPSTGIDEFVRNKLTANGLTQSPAAERRVLIRRLYLVMLGIPPTPQQVEAFVTDQSDDAWQTLVERVLSSSHYGERWATYWLDLVRFGETHGYEMNRERPTAWQYRDWVIQSLNEDKPYNEFVRQQIATLDAEIAELNDRLKKFIVEDDPKLGPSVNAKQNEEVFQKREVRFIRFTIQKTTGGEGCIDELEIYAEGSNVALASSGAKATSSGDFVHPKHKLLHINDGRHGNDRSWIVDSAKGGWVQIELAAPAVIDRIVWGRDRDGKKELEKSTVVYAGKFSQPGPTHRLYRGEPDAKREQVAPNAIEVFISLNLATNAPERDRRLALANWIASTDNPLTARVIVPAVEPDIRGAKTIRALLSLHTKSESCAGCHARFDPVALALENFDILGGWRTRYRGLEAGERITGIDRAGHDFAYALAEPVDASGQLLDGRRFQDIHELKAILAGNPRQLARSLLHQFTLYATGTPVRFADRAEIESILDVREADGYSIRDLVHALVQSRIFLGKEGSR